MRSTTLLVRRSTYGTYAMPSSRDVRRIAIRVALVRSERGASPSWYFFTANQAMARRATSILATLTGAGTPLTHGSGQPRQRPRGVSAIRTESRVVRDGSEA